MEGLEMFHPALFSGLGLPLGDWNNASIAQVHVVNGDGGEGVRRLNTRLGF